MIVPHGCTVYARFFFFFFISATISSIVQVVDSIVGVVGVSAAGLVALILVLMLCGKKKPVARTAVNVNYTEDLPINLCMSGGYRVSMLLLLTHVMVSMLDALSISLRLKLEFCKYCLRKHNYIQQPSSLIWKWTERRSR